MNNRKWMRLTALVLVGMTVLHAALVWKFRAHIRAGYSDFAIFYTAGKIVASGGGERLYDLALQYRTQLAFAPALSARRRALPYNHPPFEAWLFVPLSRLSYFSAYCLWVGINLGVVGGIFVVLRGSIPLIRERPLLLWGLMAIGYFPVFLSILQGQDILLLVLVYALSYRALRRESDWAAGRWLGLGLFRPQDVLPFAILLAFQRRWRALGGLAVVAAALALVSVATIGWRQAIHYPEVMWQMEQAGGAPEPADMPNLRGLLSAVAILGLRTWAIAGIGVGLSLLLLFWVSIRWKSHPPDRRWELGFALAIVTTLLASYHAYVYDLSLLGVAALAVANALNDEKRTDTAPLWVPFMLISLTPLYLAVRMRWHVASWVVWVALFWMGAILREMKKRDTEGAIQEKGGRATMSVTPQDS